MNRHTENHMKHNFNDMLDEINYYNKFIEIFDNSSIQKLYFQRIKINFFLIMLALKNNDYN